MKKLIINAMLLLSLLGCEIADPNITIMGEDSQVKEGKFTHNDLKYRFEIPASWERGLDTVLANTPVDFFVRNGPIDGFRANVICYSSDHCVFVKK